MIGPWPPALRAAAGAAALSAALAACSGPRDAGATATSAPAATAAPAVDAATAARLQASLDDFVAGSTTAGVSAAVLRSGGALWEGAAGMADATSGASLRPTDTMRIGSTTKTFTAAVVMALAAEGALDLEQPVAPLLPGLGLDEGLTIRHLLGHRSGLWNFTLDAGFGSSGRAWSPEEVVALAVEHGRVFPPGSHFAYSNTNYVVAGLVIEAVTGHAAEAEIRSRILAPLGLEATFMAGYEEGTVSAAPFGDPAAESGYLALDASSWTAGALAATPADLARFAAALFGGELLSPGSLEAMTTPQATYGEGAHYGLGVELLDLGGRPAWGHRGGIPGYLSALFFIPETGLSVALTANDWRGGDLMELCERLVALAS